MRRPLLVMLLIASHGNASADRGHLTGSVRFGIGSTTDVFSDPAPAGRTPVLDLELGWQAMPALSIVAFGNVTWFTDDFGDPFRSEVSYRGHQRDVDVGGRVYGHLGPVFAGLGVGAMFHRSRVDDSAYTHRYRLAQVLLGVDAVRTDRYAFGVVGLGSLAWFDEGEIRQFGLCLNARWR